MVKLKMNKAKASKIANEVHSLYDWITVFEAFSKTYPALTHSLCREFLKDKGEQK